jgi:hypothetical protein
MPNAEEIIKWILVFDLLAMSISIIKLVNKIDKKQKNKE